MKKQFLAWLILICMAWVEIKGMGHGEPFIRTTPNSAWRELLQIEKNVIQEHIHYEYYVPDLRESRQIYMPTVPTPVEPSRPEVSIVIACHNEGVFASKALMNLLTFGKDYNLEIIAIDNLSVDNTFTELSSVKDRRIKVTRFEKRIDYSYAVRSGILKTTGKYVLIFEPLLAGNLFSLSPILYSLRMHESSVVFVSRFKNGQTGRTWMMRLLTILIRLLLNIRIKDPFPLGVACSGQLSRSIVERTVEGNFRLSILYCLAKQKMSLAEIPIGLCSHPFSESHVSFYA